jgi:Molybdopterin converting factor, small subunit
MGTGNGSLIDLPATHFNFNAERQNQVQPRHFQLRFLQIIKSEKGKSMQVTVHIPTILRPLTENQKRLTITGFSVLEVIEHMEERYPGVKEKLITGGKAHRFINIYVNDDDIRFTNGLSTSLSDGDSLTILPAVAGGADPALLHT